MSFRVVKGANAISQEKRSLISLRYKRITKAVNSTFWNIDSEIAHSIYVGSYGRGTAILTSDLDVLVELPEREYYRFTSAYGNGQSRLLQAVKNAILTTYPNTEVKGDGQVVVVLFTDGMKFEILPAFKKNNGWSESYIYPDTHMGGNWLSTNPKAEQEEMKRANEYSNGLLYDTCKQIRYIRDYYYPKCVLSGILIDTFVYRFIDGWRFSDANNTNGESFEMMLYQKYNLISLYGMYPPALYAPGSNMVVDSNKGWDTLGSILKTMIL